MKLKKSLGLMVAAGMLCGSASAGVIFYADFDDAADNTYAHGDLYAFDATNEVNTDVTKAYFPSMAANPGNGARSAGDGVVLKTPDGSEGSADYPSTPGPQGGKAIILNNGEVTSSDWRGEGFWVELIQAYPVGDYTIEAVYYSNLTAVPGSANQIQAIFADEWPNQTLLKGSCRVVGNTANPTARRNKVEYTSFNAVFGEDNLYPSSYTPGWNTVQLVIDYDEAGSGVNSTYKFYVNGVQAGSTLTKAIPGTAAKGFGLSGVTIFGNYPADWDPFWATEGQAARESVNGFLVGLDGSYAISGGGDARGLRGAIDAIAISDEALDPADFILPTGYSAGTGVNEWALY